MCSILYIYQSDREHVCECVYRTRACVYAKFFNCVLSQKRKILLSIGMLPFSWDWEYNETNRIAKISKWKIHWSSNFLIQHFSIPNEYIWIFLNSNELNHNWNAIILFHMTHARCSFLGRTYYVNFVIRCTLNRYNEIIQQFMASIEHLKVIDCMNINRRSWLECIAVARWNIMTTYYIFVLKFADCFIYIDSTMLWLNHFGYSMCLFIWSFVCFGSPPISFI